MNAGNGFTIAREHLNAVSMTGSSFQIVDSASGMVNMSDLKTSAAHFVTQEPYGQGFQ